MSCPGWYCGRILQENGELSDCGSCPRGFRRNDTSFLCEPCLGSPRLYDWLYLGSMVLMVLILHWFFIDMVSMRRSFSKNVLCLHITAFFEVLASGILALLCINPIGKFTIHSCQSRSLSDWYTLLHNPRPNYEDKVYCTQEAVYPLYTIVFLFYMFALVLMLLIRPWVCRKYLPRQGKMALYAAMYFIPILILVHAVIGGLIYYSFPYLIVVISVISCAAHFAVRMDQTVSALIRSTITQPRNIVIVLGHWCLHAYGIISLTQLMDPLMHGLLLVLVPLPAIFYILTARLGQVPIKEASVIIAISSPHREEAIKATEFCINSLKQSVPIWKKEIYVDNSADWKENKESLSDSCPPKRKRCNFHITQEVQTNYVPPHLIQIKAPNADLDARIEKFMERKRAEINAHNNTEFFTRDRDPEFICSRVDAVVLKRKDSKSHLQVERVLNNYQYRDQKSSDYMKKYIPSNGIEERLQILETQLSLKKAVPKNVYQRLKHLEDRLLLLESLSPEYIQFWEKSSMPTNSVKKKVFLTTEIDELISEVEKKCAKKT